MTHDVIDVSVEELWSQLFGEVVGHVEGGVDTFQFDEVAFDPFTDDVVFNVDVTGTVGRFLGVSHSRACVVVFVCEGGGALWYPEVPHDASNEEEHLSTVRRTHEF